MQCETCGLSPTAPLIAACDVLVLRALEVIGKRTIRNTDRSARQADYRRGTSPWHTAHLDSPPEQRHVDKALDTAWIHVTAVVEAHGPDYAAPGHITRVLDTYVRDLINERRPHSRSELAWRLDALMGVG